MSSICFSKMEMIFDAWYQTHGIVSGFSSELVSQIVSFYMYHLCILIKFI